jgi:integrase
MSTLSHFLARCVEWGWTKQKLKVPKNTEARKKIVTLTPVEQQALMQAAIADQDPLSWLFVAVAMQTGMRHSEILRIKWDDIDLEARRIYIGRAKAGQREQPIPQALADMFSKERAQRDDQAGWLFPTSTKNAKHPNRQSMAEQFHRVAKRALLDPSKVTPHVLRHTAITGLVRAGVDLPTIQKISGHKTLAMVLRYTHLSDDHVDQAVANLGAAFPDTVTPELHKGRVSQQRGAA